MLNEYSILQQIFATTANRRFCIAYSGGVDSHVLLHALAECQKQHADISLRAVHVHHGLSPKADAWASHCKNICDSLNIELLVKKIHVKKTTKQSLENLARIERYAVFKDILQENESLLTAHHQDDQAETLLLQLFRGAGPKGLSAIAQTAKFGKGELLRPLLNFSREELVHYATCCKLTWVEDESNSDVNFDRNYLRHEIFPRLRHRWPGITTTLSRAARHCGEISLILQEDAERCLKNICDTDTKTLSVTYLLELSPAQQRNIIRYWLSIQGFPLPSEKKLLELQQNFLCTRRDAEPLITWQDTEIRRFRSKIYALSPAKEFDHTQECVWHLTEDLNLPNMEVLKLSSLEKMGIDCLTLQSVVVKFRQGGEKIQYKGLNRSLKKLFQEWHIPTWLRNRIPLLYQHSRLIAVYDYCICDDLNYGQKCSLDEIRESEV